MRIARHTGVIHDVEAIGRKAESLKIYTVEASTSSNTIYALAKGEVGIINKGGAIRLSLDDALKMCRELPTIIQDYKTYARDGRRI